MNKEELLLAESAMAILDKLDMNSAISVIGCAFDNMSYKTGIPVSEIIEMFIKVSEEVNADIGPVTDNLVADIKVTVKGGSDD